VFIKGPRFRKKDTPIPAQNRVLAGVLRIIDLDTGLSVGNTNTYATGPAVPTVRKRTWDQLHPGPPFKTGGPFASVEIVQPQYTVQGTGSYWSNTWYNQPNHQKYRWDGGFYNPSFPPALDTTSEATYEALGTVYNTLFPDLNSIGSGAYARLRPQLAKAGLGQAIAEMRDLPRMLQTSAKGFHSAWNSIRSIAGSSQKGTTARRYGRMAPKSASNHFINHQFGWVPFLKDVQDVYSVYQNARQLKSQISRDNNRWVRRRRVDRHIESKTLVHERFDIPGVQPTGAFFTIYDVSSYHYTIHKVTSTDVWYEGEWKYYRPEFDWDSGKAKGLVSALKREMAIYGADLNPTLVWKVTPWSWLADWFTNAGDAIQRAQDWATDSLVSKYMYLMHHTQTYWELRSQFKTIDGQSHDYVWYRSCDIKRRQAADNPFSFSLSGGNLSARQIAILGALGIART